MQKTILIELCSVLLVVNLTSPVFPAAKQVKSEQTLENDLIEAVFDAGTGALLHLINKKTGWDVQKRTELSRSFSMVVPLPDRMFNVIEGTEQQVSQIKKNAQGTELTFVWENVKSEYAGTLNIRLEAKVLLDDSGLAFNMTVDNHCPYRVESIAYPYIGDVHRRPNWKHMWRAKCFHCNLEFNELYPTFRQERGYWGVYYPVQITPTPETPYLMILGPDEGLYIGCHDTTARERVDFTFRLKPGYSRIGRVPPGDTFGGQTVNTEFMAMHLPFVGPGEKFELLPVVFKPFKGDWHAGLDYYKAWFKKNIKPAPAPKWLNEVHSWQQVQINSLADTLSVPYKELVKYGEDCKRHGVGAIQLVGWTLSGQDGRLPIHDIDPRLGTWDDLKEAIAKIQQMGVKVVLYEKYTCMDVGTDWYKCELHNYVSRDIFGNRHGHGGWMYFTPAHLSGINTRPLDWACMNCDKWQDVALGQIKKTLELDPAGILLDESQWHGKHAFYCFDPNHGHRVPAYNFAGDAVFEKKLCKLLNEKSPRLVLAGEGPYDLQQRHYNLSYNRIAVGHIPAIRYIDSSIPIMTWVRGYDDRETINLCLLYRYIISYEPRCFKGRLEEFPMTLAYGQKVDALRRKYKSFIWNAEFCDTIGAHVTAKGGQAVYTVFRKFDTGKKTVVIANHGDAAIEVQVNIGSAHGKYTFATPEEPEERQCDGVVTIPARSAGVVMEK